MKTKLLREMEEFDGITPEEALEYIGNYLIDEVENNGLDDERLSDSFKRLKALVDEIKQSPKEYIVRANEEELGSIYYSVKSSDGEEKTLKNLEMASKYSSMYTYFIDDDMLEDEEKIKEFIADGGYDEHFVEMFNVRNNTNGLDTFEYYLTDICGYEAKEIIYEVDFEFEW